MEVVPWLWFDGEVKRNIPSRFFGAPRSKSECLLDWNGVDMSGVLYYFDLLTPVDVENM